MEFASSLTTMTDYQRLRVARLSTPLKECEGQLCLMIAKKNCPVLGGICWLHIICLKFRVFNKKYKFVEFSLSVQLTPPPLVEKIIYLLK